MKKIYALVFATLCFTLSISASSIENPPVKASEVMVPVGNTGKSISLQDLSTISVKDFEDLSGSKMKGADKLLFKTAQKKIRKSINADGTLDNKQLERMYRKSGGGDGDFNIGGFALGFLLGLIGVLIAYIINNDNNSSRRKWAWIGLGAAIVISLLFLL